MPIYFELNIFNPDNPLHNGIKLYTLVLPLHICMLLNSLLYNHSTAVHVMIH